MKVALLPKQQSDKWRCTRYIVLIIATALIASAVARLAMQNYERDENNGKVEVEVVGSINRALPKILAQGHLSPEEVPIGRAGALPEVALATVKDAILAALGDPGRLQNYINTFPSNYQARGQAFINVIHKQAAAWSPGLGPSFSTPSWSFDTNMMRDMLVGDPEFPSRNVLMLWSGDWRYNDGFRKTHNLYRLEKTMLGRAMGQILGDGYFLCDDAAYATFVGSIYDVISSVLVQAYTGNAIVAAISKKLNGDTYSVKTFARQELRQVLEHNSIQSISVFMRETNGNYPKTASKTVARSKKADWTETAVNTAIIAQLPKTSAAKKNCRFQ